MKIKAAGRGRSSERGITLVEVVVVGVLAAIVMLALTGFYINSQGTWIEASSQAVTQREVSFVLGAIADSVHGSASADASIPQRLVLNEYGGSEKCRFWLNAADSLIHLGRGGVDLGPIAASTATRFEVTCDANMVRVPALEMRSVNRKLIQMSTSAAFYNK